MTQTHATATSESPPVGEWVAPPRLTTRIRPRSWAVLGFTVAVALAVGLRLHGIADDTDVSDEGIRAVQLRLMATGFWPVREIYAAQGPLSLPASYPLYVLFGGDVVAARLAVVAYSLAGLLVAMWIGSRVAGTVAGVMTGVLLAMSPNYLEGSRLALVEVLSIAPSIAALGALLRYRRGGGQGWLIGSAALLTAAILIKPMALMVGAAALVLIAAPVLSRSPRRGRLSPAARWRGAVADAALYCAVGVAMTLAVIGTIGPAEVYAQLVDYRLGARAIRRWDIAENAAIIQDELAREGIGVFVAAAAGAVILARRRPTESGALLAWLAAGLLVLLVYSPLRPKHVVYLVPPLTILAGVAFGVASRAVTVLLRCGSPGLVGAAALLASIVCLAWVPTVAAEDRRLLNRQRGEDHVRYGDDLRTVAAATVPGDFIVMDDAYLAQMTGRLMPPHMADLSYTRILARTLASERAKVETERFKARVVVVQDDHLGQQPRYIDWLDRNYLLVKSYVRRAPNRWRRVYARPDVDLAAVRATLADRIEHPWRAEAGPVAILGYTLDRRELRPGDLFWLTVHWEALVASPRRHDAVIRLRGPAGEAEQENSIQIGDGDQRLVTWGPGRWQIQTYQVQVNRRLRPGTYVLTLALESSGGSPAPITVHGDAVTKTANEELVLETIRVR